MNEEQIPPVWSVLVYPTVTRTDDEGHAAFTVTSAHPGLTPRQAIEILRHVADDYEKELNNGLDRGSEGSGADGGGTAFGEADAR